MEDSCRMVRNTCQTAVQNVCAEMAMFTVNPHTVQWQDVGTRLPLQESAAPDVIMVINVVWSVPIYKMIKVPGHNR